MNATARVYSYTTNKPIFYVKNMYEMAGSWNFHDVYSDKMLQENNVNKCTVLLAIAAVRMYGSGRKQK